MALKFYFDNFIHANCIISWIISALNGHIIYTWIISAMAI